MTRSIAGQEKEKEKEKEDNEKEEEKEKEKECLTTPKSEAYIYASWGTAPMHPPVPPQ